MPVTRTAGRSRTGTLLPAALLPVALLALAALAAACAHRGGSAGPTGSGSAGKAPAGITVTSPAFPDGGRLPARFTCDGAGTAPPLAWSGVPDSARSLALIVDDPDAPGGTYTHWVVGGLAPTVLSIGDRGLPRSAIQAVNSAGRTGYAPPCPPSGTHHYRFTVLALDVARPFSDGAATSAALAAIHAAATRQGTLVGLYARSDPPAG